LVKNISKRGHSGDLGLGGGDGIKSSLGEINCKVRLHSAGWKYDPVVGFREYGKNLRASLLHCHLV